MRMKQKKGRAGASPAFLEKNTFWSVSNEKDRSN